MKSASEEVEAVFSLVPSFWWAAASRIWRAIGGWSISVVKGGYHQEVYKLLGVPLDLLCIHHFFEPF